MSEFHARFSPSSAHRWIRCPGSISLEEELQLEDTTSIYAEEGTAAHELAAKALIEKKDCAQYIGQHAENGIEWTEEMADYIQAYVNEIQARGFDADTLDIERRVYYSDYVDCEDQSGTADAIVVKEGFIEVHDLKYGKGVQVFSEDNEQLMLYGLGAYDKFNLLYDIEEVKLFIHQPRLDHIDEWAISTEDLLKFADKAKEAVQNALSGRPRFAAGEKQCRWCKAKAFCKTAADLVGQTLSNSDAGFDVIVRDAQGDEPCAVKPDSLSIADLEKAYGSLDFIKEWCSAVYTRTLDEARAGKTKKFKAIKGRKGNRAWNDTEEVAKMLKAMRFKNEEMYTYNLISPTVAEKALANSPKRWNKLAKRISQPEGKLVLAPMSNKAPAVIDAVQGDDGFDDLTTADLV